MKMAHTFIGLATLLVPRATAQTCPAGFTCTPNVMTAPAPLPPPGCPPGFFCIADPPATKAQQAVTAAESAVKTITAPPPACPTSFYAAGGTYNSAASPKLGGFYAIATPVTKCGSTFQAYSITTNILTPSGSGTHLSFTSTTTTGAAIPMKQIGPINVYAFGNVGVAAGATTTKLGSNWGGFATVPLPFWSMKIIPIGQNVNGKWTFGIAAGRSW